MQLNKWAKSILTANETSPFPPTNIKANAKHNDCPAMTSGLLTVSARDPRKGLRRGVRIRCRAGFYRLRHLFIISLNLSSSKATLTAGQGEKENESERETAQVAARCWLHKTASPYKKTKQKRRKEIVRSGSIIYIASLGEGAGLVL